jgi:hypothetical protein
VLEWLQLDTDGSKKSDAALVFSDETGGPAAAFRTAARAATLSTGLGCWRPEQHTLEHRRSAPSEVLV